MQHDLAVPSARPPRPPRPSRPTRFAGAAQFAGAVAAGAIVAVAAVAAAPAAQAHGGDPEITVEAVHPLSDGSFHFIVEMVYEDDGDPISGKTVTATPTSPSGATGAAVTLDPGSDGVYQGPVPLTEDGTWTVEIASADPAGSIDYGYQVTGDTGTPVGAVATAEPAEPAATTAPATTATTAAPTTTTAAPTTTEAPAGPETEAATARATDDDDDSSLPIVLLAIGAALVVALAGVPLALRTIRNATGHDPKSTGDDGRTAPPTLSD